MMQIWLRTQKIFWTLTNLIVFTVIFLENGIQTEHLASNYKKHIKELVEENIPNAVFVKSIQSKKPKPDVYFDSRRIFLLYRDTFVDEHDMKSLQKLAKKLGGEVLQCKWKFSGNFDCFESPALLTAFMKWLLLGPYTN